MAAHVIPNLVAPPKLITAPPSLSARLQRPAGRQPQPLDLCTEFARTLGSGRRIPGNDYCRMRLLALVEAPRVGP